MEVSVSFTDEDEAFMLERGYIADDSPIGKVYYPSSGVAIDGEISVLYEKKPWLEAFRVTGLKPVLVKRQGPGEVGREEFARMSLEFYDVEMLKDESFVNYFANMTNYFVSLMMNSIDAKKNDKDRLKCASFIGFVENMWRLGDSWSEQLVKDTILPMIYQDEPGWNWMMDIISDDFREYINLLI